MNTSVTAQFYVVAGLPFSHFCLWPHVGFLCINGVEQFSFPLALQQTIYDNEDGEQISLPAPSLYGFQGKGSAGGALGDPPACSLPGLPRRAAGRGKWSPWCLRSRREVNPEMGRGKELPLRPPVPPLPSRPPARRPRLRCGAARRHAGLSAPPGCVPPVAAVTTPPAPPHDAN